MTKEQFAQIEIYMLSCMDDSAHDPHHVYRVLYYAMELAQGEAVNRDILITACLLHDIGRKEQFEDPTVCHAAAGAQKAEKFLRALGWAQEDIHQVCHCIRAHRFSKKSPPETMEAKILFDADKLDVVGVAGVARTLLYQGTMGQSLYTLTPEGTVSDGTAQEIPSFFQEYKRKLEKLYTGFLTEKGLQIALNRQGAAQRFYEELYAELNHGYQTGKALLHSVLED